MPEERTGADEPRQAPSVSLSALGPRICILGPSNSGKSTFAEAIGRKRGLEVVHLDRLFHLPNTDWRQRPSAEFATLHDAAIARNAWVIDGNYSQVMPQRLARATGLIVLDVPTGVSLARYLRRTLLEPIRAGGLEGGQESLKWEMIRHIVRTTPANRRAYADLFERVALPKVRLASLGAIKRCLAEWDL